MTVQCSSAVGGKWRYRADDGHYYLADERQQRPVPGRLARAVGGFVLEFPFLCFSFGLLGDTKGQFDGNALAVLLTRSTPFRSSPADGAHVRWSDANGAELFGRSAEDE